MGALLSILNKRTEELKPKVIVYVTTKKVDKIQLQLIAIKARTHAGNSRVSDTSSVVSGK